MSTTATTVAEATDQLGPLGFEHLVNLVPATQELVFPRGTAEASSLTRSTLDVAALLRELSGDTAATLTDVAAEVAGPADASVVFRDVMEGELRNSFLEMGIPEPMSAMLADADEQAKGGAPEDEVSRP